jgi:hypothetical protein
MTNIFPRESDGFRTNVDALDMQRGEMSRKQGKQTKRYAARAGAQVKNAKSSTMSLLSCEPRTDHAGEMVHVRLGLGPGD